jgi:hypothetical protein
MRTEKGGHVVTTPDPAPLDDLPTGLHVGRKDVVARHGGRFGKLDPTASKYLAGQW